MLASAALMIFASCSKEEGNTGKGNPNDGPQTTLGLAFTMPNNPGSRAADGDNVNSVGTESEVTNVQVFVFNTDGTYDAEVGYAEFAKADFTQAETTYTLDTEKAIKAVAGGKHIYVGINLPAAFKGKSNVADEAALKNAVRTFAISDLVDPTKGIAMFSTGSPNYTLAAMTEGSTDIPAANTIKLDVERMVAKVVAQTSTNNGEFSTKYNTGTLEINVDYAVQGYTLVQGSNTMYTAQNLVNNVLVTPNPTTVNAFTGAETFVNMNNNTLGEAFNDPAFTYIYTGENAPTSGLVKESTYMLVKTKATPNKKAVVTADAIALQAWDGSGDMWIVRGKEEFAGAVYFCVDDTSANDVALKCKGTFQKYLGCYAYYMVWLNLGEDADTDRLHIYRNQFVHVKITGISGSSFTATPGKEPSGETPKDPTDEDDEETPDPTDPVVAKKTSMLVEVTLKPWTYKGNSVILGE